MTMKRQYPDYFELRKSKRLCNLCGNFKVPRHLLEVDHWFDNQYWYFLYQDGIHVDRDSPENLWVLCKYCHTRKSHWESIGDYWTIERLVEKVKTPELRDALCNSSAKWISEHQDKKLKGCEYDKWVIPDDPNEPFYK